jgi:hypothetical protein
MIWGIVALFVMMSVWGIVGFFQKEFGLEVTVPGKTPTSKNVSNTGLDTPCSNFDPDMGGPCDF